MSHNDGIGHDHPQLRIAEQLNLSAYLPSFNNLKLADHSSKDFENSFKIRIWVALYYDQIVSYKITALTCSRTSQTKD